jgi:hypothetical protein
MHIAEMTNEALAAFHAETLAKARRARCAADLDLAQRYLRVLMPINAEMVRRMEARRAA